MTVHDFVARKELLVAGIEAMEKNNNEQYAKEQQLLAKVRDSLYVSTSRSLIVCPTCKGRGITSEEICVSYHNNDYETKHSKCTKCNCTGKLVETKIFVRLPTDLEEKTSRPATEQDIEAMVNKGHL
jgi:hypothetical protein